MSRKFTVASLIALFCLVTISVVGYAQDKVDVNGIIKNRTGDTLVVATDSGDATVVLTEETRTKDNKGLFGLDREEMGSTVLIPGLKVDVDGTHDSQGRTVAKTITVDGDDLEASEMIQAGLHPTAEQVAANVQRLEAHQKGIEANAQSIASNQQEIASNRQKIESNIKQTEQHAQRFAALDDYDVKGQTTVKFNTGSSALSRADQTNLKLLAKNATQLPVYLIEVIGYADSTGKAAMNTTLSENRAKAVVTYLVQQCGVPSRRVVAPAAMGEYGPAASNETKAGRADNRRAEVKVLVNKGVSGQGQ